MRNAETPQHVSITCKTLSTCEIDNQSESVTKEINLVKPIAEKRKNKYQKNKKKSDS